jgi:epsilon-lactone hydrolase
VHLRDEGDRLPVALAATSPWADLTLTAPGIAARATVEIMLSQRGLTLDADRYRGALPARDPRVSPLFADLSGLPPTLIQVGSDEILHDDALTLAERLDAARVEIRLQIWQAMGHAWAAFGEAVPEAAASITDLGRFLRQRLDA